MHRVTNKDVALAIKQALIHIQSKECTECKGDGQVEKIVWHPHTFDRDIGCESSTIETCEKCSGDGRIPCET